MPGEPSSSARSRQCLSEAGLTAEAAEKAGWPLDGIVRCCRSDEHDGRHVAIYPLGNAPGTARAEW